MQNLIDAANSNATPVKNVRVPSLQSGCMYLMKDWSNNKLSVVLFNGCKNAAGPVAQNFALKEMQEGDVYSFTAVDKSETYAFDAYSFENCLSIGTDATRVTFFSFAGAAYPDASVLQAPAKPRKLVVRNVVEEEDEEPALYADEDLVDEAPIGVVVGQLSAKALRRATVMLGAGGCVC